MRKPGKPGTGGKVAIQERLSIVEDGPVGITIPETGEGRAVLHLRESVDLLFFDTGMVARKEGKPIPVHPGDYMVQGEHVRGGDKLVAIWPQRYRTHPNAVAFDPRKMSISRTVGSVRQETKQRKGSSL